MAVIIVNDIFEELFEENLKITECLKVLIRFKTFVDIISDKLKNNMESNVLEMFEDLHQEVNEVFIKNKKDFSVHKNSKQTKLQLFESLTLEPKTTLHLPSDQSIVSTKVSNEVKPRLSHKKTSSSGQTPIKKIRKDLTIDENTRYVCDFIGCGHPFKSRDSLRNHRTVHSTKAKRYECDFKDCSYTSMFKTRIRDHMNSHKGIKPFSCDFCDKQFTTQRLKKSHTGLIHKVADQILICDLEDCRKEFTTELSLRNHQNLMHLKEKRFVCEEPNCAFKTVTAYLLKEHFISFHSEIRSFFCEFEGCSKAFKRMGDLKKHNAIHTSERNFKCQFEGCNKAFKTADCLRGHNRLHIGPEVKCDWPGCEYTTKNLHVLTVHQNFHRSERNFICEWPQCGKGFKSKIHLETHKRIHNNDKRFVCSWPGCQYRCTDSGNLVKHKRVHIK